MSLCAGIDLGSTTSKAVLVDEHGSVLGRGLTNTRANYDVAAKVAQDEALADARLNLLQRELEARTPERAARVGSQLRRAFAASQSIERLKLLGARISELARTMPGGSDERAEALRHVVGRLEADADAIFGPLAEDRSRFFRDLAGARFFAEAEAAAQRNELPFELAVGAYDRGIMECENAEERLDSGELLARALDRAQLDPVERREVEEAAAAQDSESMRVECVVGTGYGRQRLPFPKEQIRSEILCHGLGAHAFYPGTRTVLDIGGQDTKAIQIDGDGMVQNFQMNDRCAAGCGRYLGYIADEMNLGLHELGPLALTATRAIKISSTCTVFAGVELRELLSLGERRENILLGLHRAILLRALGLLSRSGGIHDEFTFTGGVAKNVAIVQELRLLVDQHYGPRTLNIHPDSIYTGALGAALFALHGGGENAPVKQPARKAASQPEGRA